MRRACLTRALLASIGARLALSAEWASCKPAASSSKPGENATTFKRRAQINKQTWKERKKILGIKKQKVTYRGKTKLIRRKEEKNSWRGKKF